MFRSAVRSGALALLTGLILASRANSESGTMAGGSGPKAFKPNVQQPPLPPPPKTLSPNMPSSLQPKPSLQSSQGPPKARGTLPPTGYGATGRVYFDGLTNLSCIDPSVDTSSTPPKITFWQPTYYVEIVTEREKSYLFPPFGQKLLKNLADLLYVDTSKKAVIETIVKAINPAMRDAVLEVLDTGMAYTARSASPGSAESPVSHFREAHVWKYRNPDAFSELPQALICYVVSKVFGSKQGEDDAKDMLTNLAKNPPILFPAYLSEIDWFQWNSGLFDIIFGRTFRVGDELGAWGRKYARTGMVYDADQIRSTLLTAARVLSRASDDFTGGFVERNIYVEPDKFKMNVIFPDSIKTDCFKPGDNLKVFSDTNERFAKADQIMRVSDAGLLVWEKVGNTNKLNQCIGKAFGEFVGTRIVYYAAQYYCQSAAGGATACATGFATAEAIDKIAKILDVLQTLNQYYRFVETVLEAIAEAIELYEDAKDTIQFAKTAYTLAG